MRFIAHLGVLGKFRVLYRVCEDELTAKLEQQIVRRRANGQARIAKCAGIFKGPVLQLC